MADTKQADVKISPGLRASLKVWLSAHSKCGGEHITYIDEHEFRIGCTCSDGGK